MSFQRYTAATTRTDISNVQRYTAATTRVDCEAVKRYTGSAWTDVWTNTPWVFSDPNSKHVRGQYVYIASGTATISGEFLKTTVKGSESHYTFIYFPEANTATISGKYRLQCGNSGVTGNFSRSAGSNYVHFNSPTSGTFPNDSTTTLTITLNSGSAPLYIKSIGHNTTETARKSLYEA